MASTLRIVVNPQYVPNADDYDMAVLLLDEPVDADKYPNIRPICLPTLTPPDNSIVSPWVLRQILSLRCSSCECTVCLFGLSDKNIKHLSLN